jgi:microcystin-dependent protein
LHCHDRYLPFKELTKTTFITTLKNIFMAESLMGEIQVYAFNFAPYQWAMCWGQIMSISQNTALFSLLGTYYGGNGTSTFGLPDLRSRVAVGYGQGPGLSNYTLGEMGGTETATMMLSNMPIHTHALIGGDNVVKVSSQKGTSPTANSTTHTLGGFDDTVNLQATNNAYGSSAPDVALNTGGSISGTIGATGGSVPFNMMQPTLGLNYCISLYGYYPSRN